MLLTYTSKFDFSARPVHHLLVTELKRLNARKTYQILDLGCGDGVMIDDLHRLHLLKKNLKVTAVDISEDNIRIAKKRGLKAKFLVANAEGLPFKKDSFDVIYSWMVLEHVSQPDNMLKEIKRTLKKDGVCYLSTVMKKKWSVYFYRRNGKFCLDPTHVHEFESKEELYDLFQKSGLTIHEFEVSNCTYSLFELMMKLLIKIHFVRPTIETRLLFSKNSLLNVIKEKTKIPIPGFYIVNIICR